VAGIRRSLAGIGANFKDVVYFSKPLEARHEFLTANNQTPYVVSVLDLHRGPVVLELPPADEKIALFGTVCDSWQVPLVDVGPAGEDAGKGGKYLFLPPGYAGERHMGYITVQAPTFFVHAAIRPIMLGHATLADAVASSQTMSSRAEHLALAQVRAFGKPIGLPEADIPDWSCDDVICVRGATMPGS
jgi:hypothetical protein